MSNEERSTGISSVLQSNRRLPLLLSPGQMKCCKAENVLWVGCREGCIGFRAVKFANKKVMTPNDFNNGFLSKVSKSALYFDKVGL